MKVARLLPLLMMELCLQVSAAEFTIGTLNCEFLNWRKCHMKFGERFDFNGWTDAERDAKFAEASQAVGDFIRDSFAPDVLVLTEVGKPEEVAQLLEVINGDGMVYGHHAVCDSTDSSTGQHVAVLSRFPLLDIRDQISGREGFIPEPDDAEEDDTGISKGMRASFDVDGTRFVLFAVHLSSERGGHEQDQQRIAQASIVRRHTFNLLDEANDFGVIVAGDLNDMPLQPALKRIRGFDDMWPDLIQTRGERYVDDLSERWTYVFKGRRQQIDHVLVSPNMRRWVKETTYHSAPSELVTDHRGVMVRVEVE